MSADSPTPILSESEIAAEHRAVALGNAAVFPAYLRLRHSHEALRDAVAVLTEERDALTIEIGAFDAMLNEHVEMLGDAERRVAVLEAGLRDYRTTVSHHMIRVEPTRLRCDCGWHCPRPGGVHYAFEAICHVVEAVIGEAEPATEEEQT